MDLTIDFGNTLTKAAVFSGSNMMYFKSFKQFSPTELSSIFKRFPEINKSIISSVVCHPAEINGFLGQHTHFLELNKNTPLPITNDYKTPQTLGKDRISAAVAGHSLHPGKNVLVIMAGTCITYDFVDEEGHYHGGAISPGIRMRLKALNHFTDHLPHVDPEMNAPLIGSTSESSILSGVINGTTTEVDGIIDKYQKNYKNLTVILSGGDTEYFDKKLKNNIFAVPNIVLLGLKYILDFNAS